MMIKRIKQQYKNMPIREKIIIVYVTCFVFFMILVLLVSNLVLYQSNITKVEQNIQDECGVINLQISNIFNNLDICQKSTIQGINQTYEELETKDVDHVSFVSVKNNLYYVINYYRGCFSDVDSIVFVDTKNNIVSTGLAHTPTIEELEELINRIPSFGPVNTMTFSVESHEYFDGDQKTGILTLGKRIINFNTGENLGYLFTNVKTSTIADIFPQSAGQSYHKNYYIIDDRNKIIVTEDTSYFLKTFEDSFVQKFNPEETISFQTVRGNEKVLVTGLVNSNFHWTLINEVPVRDVVKDIYYMTFMIILIGVVCTITAVFLMLILSRVITNPIRSLTETAAEISGGNLSRRCVVDSQDEVGILAKNFNAMLEKIQTLLVQVKNEQKQKRETELALFQIQTKPHFLYNTLDLIYVCCLMDDAKVGGKIAKALADFYRICLSNGAEVISIQEEIQNIENYLLIQQERYSDIITYHIEVPETLWCYKIPKLTLQPLVENAIYHGLKEKDGHGCVSIVVYEQENNIVLEVKDDGVGMSQDMFEILLHKKDDSEKKHFGLKNVHERLQLYFGEEYGLSMSMEPGLTCIKVLIPKVEVYND